MSTLQQSPQPSATQTAYAPAAASQPSWNASAPNAAMQQAPASMPPGVMPQAPMPTQPSWDSAQTQQPWQAAFNQLIGAPMPTAPSTAWAAPSPSIQQGLTPAQVGNWGQMAPAIQAAPMAAPIYSPQQTQAYSPTQQEMAQLAQAAAAQTIAQQQALAEQGYEESVDDSFLAGISNESLEVLSHFGAEAPAKLNAYSCQVEDALLEALGHQQQQAQAIAEQVDYIERVQAVLEAAGADREAMMHILTDPETLADYTTRFFSDEGPYPVHTPAEEAQAALQQGMIYRDGPLMPSAENPRLDINAQPGYQRPQMPAMPNPAASGGYGDPWAQFSQAMDVAPQDAWKVLAGASPDAVRRKVLFMED